jgi:hypothetical protein
MKHEHDYNEQGYCKACGERQSLNGWPTGTWMQKRLAWVRLQEVICLPSY